MGGPPETGQHELDRTMSREPRTTVAEETLRALGDQLLRVPDGFEVHRKLKPFLDRRRAAFEDPDGRIDWAHAEALAFASLLALGVPIRLTGQDTERGTFSQRHAVLHDAATGERWCALQNLRDANAPFELHNSPLSEQACMGFEYGYSVQAPDALVLWEAQFGDFVNSAQVIVDQFLISGLAKWGQTSRLTPAAPARLRGLRPRALERPPRALPADGRRGQHPRRQLHHARPVLPPAAQAGAGVQAAPADLDDAEEPAPPAGRNLDRRRPRRGRLRAGDRRPGAARGPRGGDQARALLGQGLLRHRDARGARRRLLTSRSRGWSCSTRSRRPS